MSDELLLPLLYDSAGSGGWHAGMAAITWALLDGLPLAPAPHVLEVGCGGGATLRLLVKRLPGARIVGIDLNSLSVQTAAEAPGAAVAQANMLQLPFAGGRFDLLLALDSMDQREVPLPEALAEAARVLKPGGRLVLRVSAYPRLYGAHDRAFGTGRRFTRSELLTALAAQGFSARRVTHANLLLGAPVAAMRLLQRARERERGGGLYGSAAANRALHAALVAEAFWLRRAPLPAGLSLLVCAHKEPS